MRLYAQSLNNVFLCASPLGGMCFFSARVSQQMYNISEAEPISALHAHGMTIYDSFRITHCAALAYDTPFRCVPPRRIEI